MKSIHLPIALCAQGLVHFSANRLPTHRLPRTTNHHRRLTENLLPSPACSRGAGGEGSSTSLSPPRRSGALCSGVSLMEVLISIGIMLFGLLGVAALLPVGRFEMVQALRADRAASVGRSALREIKVRRMQYPAKWFWYVDSGTVRYPNAYFPVAVDPLGRLQGAITGPNDYVSFPYATANSSVNVGCTGSNLWLTMPRVTLAEVVDVNDAVRMQLQCERLFRCRDDLKFNLPETETSRPQQTFVGPSGGSLIEAPSVNPSTSGALATASDGNYSWLATVVPANTEYFEATTTRTTARKFYNVSVVVFYNRQPGDAQELTCAVTPQGNLVGGGEVILGDLSLSSPNPSPPPGNAAEVRSGEWILLRGRRQRQRIDPSTNTLALHNEYDFKWYKVIATDEMNPATNTRRVTLAGPDWALAEPASTGATTAWTVCAGVFPGAIGVYTETMELER